MPGSRPRRRGQAKLGQSCWDQLPLHWPEPRDELAMLRHARDLLHVGSLESVKEFAKALFGQLVGDRVISFGNDVLADHDVDPGARVEQFIKAWNDACSRSEKVDLMLQLLGNFHRPKAIPERLTLSPVGVIVKDDEVADPLHFKGRAGIVIIAR